MASAESFSRIITDTVMISREPPEEEIDDLIDFLRTQLENR